MDNSNKKYWFRAKMYGWGWQPTSWQGWVIILIYVAIMAKFVIIANKAHSSSDFLINFSLPFVVFTSILLAICYKTGEKPRWRWGK